MRNNRRWKGSRIKFLYLHLGKYFKEINSAVYLSILYYVKIFCEIRKPSCRRFLFVHSAKHAQKIPCPCNSYVKKAFSFLKFFFFSSCELGDIFPLCRIFFVCN